MTAERGRQMALTTLISLQDVGGFTLPDELLKAAALPGQVNAVPLPTLADYDHVRASDAVLDDLANGRTPDLDGYAAEILKVVEARGRHDHAKTILQAANEHASTMAVNTAADLADRVITDSLRPAFTAVLEQVGQHAATLKGQSLDPRSLLTAPAKVRTAYLETQSLGSRFTALRQAREKANVAGLRAPQEDTKGEFSFFRCPHAGTDYAPGSTAQPPRIEFPQDPTEMLLWLVGPMAQAEPWLPTAAEQDAAWHTTYGAAAEMRRATSFKTFVGGPKGLPLSPTAV